LTEVKQSFLARMRAKINRPGSWPSYDLANLVPGRKIDAEVLDELETRLLTADVGVEATGQILDELRKRVARQELDDVDKLIAALTDAITAILLPVQKPLDISTHRPFVLLVVGVNGSGKTTTIGKLAAKLHADGKSVMLCAADTFRAAAIDQLKIWAGRSGASVLAREPGADAAGLAYDALAEAKGEEIDVLLVDTAGRLQNKAVLMDELEKMVRVIKKLDASAPHAVLLVLDATVGQNALSQVEEFRKTAGVTGLVMTKLDGTARGGILVAIAAKHKLPVHFIGVGEGIDDLAPFAAKDFANAIAGVGG